MRTQSVFNDETDHDRSADWELTEPGTRAASLIIELRRSTWVYPWFMFGRALGSSDSVVLTFGKDLISVRGNRLHVLTRAIAEHRVLRLIQPTPNETKFNVRGDGAVLQTGRPTISSISICPKGEKLRDPDAYQAKISISLDGQREDEDEVEGGESEGEEP